MPTMRNLVLPVVATAIAALTLSVALVAQQPAGHKPAYSPKRTPDGQPDIQGTYNNVGGEAVSIEPGFDVNVGTGFYENFFNNLDVPGAPKRDAKDRPTRGTMEIPYQPWARAKKLEFTKEWTKKEGTSDVEHLDPTARCLPSGVPRTHFRQGPHQILQTPGKVVIFDEFNHQYRVIPVDGRPPVGPRIRLWMGSSRGRWDGDTLIVDTTNFNGKTWFDSSGSHHSDELRLVERFSMIDANTIDYQVTIEDPKVFTRPWELRASFVRADKGYEALEYACLEGNRSLDNYLIK